MKLTTKKIAWRIYEITFNGRVYQIDGQNFHGTTNEWELFEVNFFETKNGAYEELHHVDTYRTKKDALNDLPNLIL